MSAAATAYEDWKLMRMCDGKIRFRSKALAHQSAIRIRYELGEDLHSYQCLNCMEWHNGHDRNGAN